MKVRKESEQFTLTNHAIRRMTERFPEMMREINHERVVAKRLRQTYELLWAAKLEKRVLNDFNFMQFIHEKYGFEKSYKFFVNGLMVFVGTTSEQGNFIVTVVNRDNFRTAHMKTPQGGHR